MLTFLLPLPELDPETIDFKPRSQSTCFIFLVYYTIHFNQFICNYSNINSLILFFRYSPNISLRARVHSNGCIKNTYQNVCIRHTYSREFIYYAHTHNRRCTLHTHILECMNYIHMHESVHCAHTH